MDVQLLHGTRNAEELVCRAARGDYTETSLVSDVPDVDDSDRYVHREPGEDTQWVEPDVPFEDIMNGTTEELIQQLLQRGHYGPFEHVQAIFTVSDVSRVTMAQITRHRMMSFDVQSMRYVDFSSGSDVVVPKSLRSADHFSRETGEVDLYEEDRAELREQYESLVEDASSFYEDAVEMGMPKEDARFGLPLGSSVSWTMSGNARHMLHVLDMRRKGDAQWEVRELSDLMLEELKDWMPNTFEYYENNGPNRLSP
jgi:thymidylate synthase (FAD)